MGPLMRDGTEPPQLVVTLAKSAWELREAQRLRYRVFADECGIALPNRSAGIDADIFDPYCDHLIVRDIDSDDVVGTCRVLSPSQAREAGQFYAETAFDLINLKPLVPRMVETGRLCIHRNYRRGGTILRLWAGLVQYLLTGGYEYLMGCASISLVDGGSLAAGTYLSLRNTRPSPDYWRVVPHRRYPIASHQHDGKPGLAPSAKEYLRLGAYICGEPSWNERLNTADLLLLLPLSGMDPRYVRHFRGTPCHNHARVA
ncbi:GNAT family N-acetyltransferase [Nitrospira sp. NS4]|uniref:GNAT family N-acetyltransferase n=1 Tax=Nitrospira sp. NS4 TaxID=3414498 RepID=UPI003C2BD364